MQTPIQTIDPTLKSWRRRVFAATWLSYFGFYFCRKPFFIVKSALATEFGWDAAQVGMVGTAYLVAYAVGQFIAGALGDRLGPRVLLLGGMAVSIGCNIAFGFSTSWAAFAGFMVLNGLAQATGWSGNVGAIAPWFRRRERGTVMGFWATNYQVGGVAANALAAWMLGAYGVRWAFSAGSAVLLLVWAFFVFNQRNKPEDVGLAPLDDDDGPLAGDVVVSGDAVVKDDGKWPREVLINVLLVGVFYFFVKFIRYALWSWAPWLLQRNYGLAGDEAGFVSTIFDLTGIAGVIVIGFVSDKYFGGRRVKVSTIFVVGMAISCVLLYTLGPASLVLFATSMGLIGFTLYGPDALMTGAGAIDVGSLKRATLAAGIINGMGSVGGVVQELLLGSLLKTDDVGAVFGALLGSSLAAVFCLVLLLRRNQLGKADL